MTAAWNEARRILAVRLDAMGDLLMTEPALRALSDGGERHLTLLTSAAGAELAPMLPQVNEAIIYAAPWMKAGPPHPDPGADGQLITRLRAGGYDAAVIFTVSTQSPLPAALVCHLAGIPLRAAHCRENPYLLLTDWVREPEPELKRHEVERQLALVAELGFSTASTDLRIRIPETARQAARAQLVEAGIDLRRPWLALHPGASAPSRRYPLGGYASALAELADEGWQAVIVGGAPEVQACRRLCEAVDRPAVRLLAGDLSLPDLAAVIEAATLFIGNNSGPAHLAAATGTPSVILYALTNLQHTPWGVQCRVLSHDVPCRNCLRSVCPMGHHLCLRGVSPRRIVDSVHELGDAAQPAAAAV